MIIFRKTLLFYSFFSRLSLYFFVCFYCLCAHVLADSTSALPKHRVIFDTPTYSGDYRLTLSALKKINSEWVSERERKVSGSISRQTIEFTGTLGLSDIWQQLSTAFYLSSKQVLFECEGLDCGSSNAWANNRFEIKQLYGLDTTQYYRVMETVKSGHITYDILYLVQRGNRRIYAQLDQVVVESYVATLLTYESVVETLRNKGFMAIPSSYKKNTLVYDDRVIQIVARVISMHPEWHVAFVGHSLHDAPSSVVSGSASLLVSTQYAQHFLEKLDNLSYTPPLPLKNIQTFGVGPLAPRNFFADERVEMILLK